MSQSMKALQAMLTEGISLTEAADRFGISKAAVSKAKLHPSKICVMTKTIEQLAARVAELGAEVEEQRSDHLKLVEENHELRQQRDLAVEALERVQASTSMLNAGSISTSALRAIKESEVK